MSESNFPSGPWTGFYTYEPGDKHRMDLTLEFRAGLVTGEGNDDVGPFLVKGKFSSTSLECHWNKTYVGGHDVFCKGYREGKGIWGTWEISSRWHGGFHIWPRGASSGETVAAAEEISELVDAVGVQTN